MFLLMAHSFTVINLNVLLFSVLISDICIVDDREDGNAEEKTKQTSTKLTFRPRAKPVNSLEEMKSIKQIIIS